MDTCFVFLLKIPLYSQQQKLSFSPRKSIIQIFILLGFDAIIAFNYKIFTMYMQYVDFLLGGWAGVWAALVPQSGQAAHKGRKEGRHGSRLLLIRLIIGSKRLKARFTFDNRKELIGRSPVRVYEYGRYSTSQPAVLAHSLCLFWYCPAS